MEVNPNDDDSDAEIDINEDNFNEPITAQIGENAYFSSSSSTSSSYFESSSQSEDDTSPAAVQDQLISRHATIAADTVPSLIFSTSAEVDKELVRENAQGLARQEFGGIVVYDSCARMVGNTHIQNYYDQIPPQKIDFNVLFTPQEVSLATSLFTQEAKERDFSSDFDKFLYKHLPKFQPQRDYEHPQFTISVPQQENILIFDSRFENGNLRRAIKVNNIEYNLWLENDLNTKGHTQWFYFKVMYKYPKSKIDYGCDYYPLIEQKIQFNILNLMKTQSLYQTGMKPYIFSKQKHLETGQGWFRGGEEVKYSPNKIPRKKNASTASYNKGNTSVLYNNNGAGEGADCYFTLSFWYEFEYEEDEVTFAHAIPYTYSDMQRLIKDKIQDHSSQNIVRANILCNTLAGLPCPLVTITENCDSYLSYYDEVRLQRTLPNLLKKQLKQKLQKCRKLYKQSLESKGKVRKLLRAAFEEEINSFCESNQETFEMSGFSNFNQTMKSYLEGHCHKKAIILTSRVHPGEPQSSHMLEGAIEYLLSDQAEQLRKHFVFRIIPMLNVDGVVYGNYRCSLLGVDLNRKWVQPNKFLHPEVYYVKHLIKSTHHERRVLMYCDMHGHSRKQNAFFYSCSYKNYEYEGRIKNAQLRMVPLLCCHKNDIFSFKECRFRIERCKEQTARVVVFKEFNILNSFTLESSFFAKEDADGKISPLLLSDYRSLGETLMQTMHNYLPQEQEKLNILSGKILEIFYEEFVKFIPAYVLRKEEEKMKQQKDQPSDHPQPMKQEKRKSSPKGTLILSTQIKRVKKKGALLEKGKPKKQKTANFTLKKENALILMAEDMKKMEGESEEQNFSEIIQIHNNQEELLEIESFIQKEHVKIKQQLSSKKMAKKLGGGSILSEEEEDNEKDQTDSSDSEDSVKQIFTKQQEQQQTSTNKSKKGSKRVSKKMMQANSTKSNEKKPSYQGSFKEDRPPRKESFMSQFQPVLEGKKKRKYKEGEVNLESPLRNQASQIETVRDSLALDLDNLVYDKIPHRKTSSPISSKSQIPNPEPNLLVEESKANGLQSFEDFDLASQQQQLRKPIIPLYENAQYHQKRLQNTLLKNQALINYDQPHDQFSTQDQSPTKSLLNRPSTQHETGTTRMMLLSNLNHDVDKSQQHRSHHPYEQKTIIALNNQVLQPPFTSANRKRTQHYVKSNETFRQQGNNNKSLAKQNQSVQRISFKDLVESSRQHRGGSNDATSNNRSHIVQQIANSSHLINMLRHTYHKFQYVPPVQGSLQEDQQIQEVQVPIEFDRSPVPVVSSERKLNLLNSHDKQPLVKTPISLKRTLNNVFSSPLRPQPQSEQISLLQNIQAQNQMTSRDQFQIQQLRTTQSGANPEQMERITSALRINQMQSQPPLYSNYQTKSLLFPSRMPQSIIERANNNNIIPTKNDSSNKSFQEQTSVKKMKQLQMRVTQFQQDTNPQDQDYPFFRNRKSQIPRHKTNGTNARKDDKGSKSKPKKASRQ